MTTSRPFIFGLYFFLGSLENSNSCLAPTSQLAAYQTTCLLSTASCLNIWRMNSWWSNSIVLSLEFPLLRHLMTWYDGQWWPDLFLSAPPLFGVCLCGNLWNTTLRMNCANGIGMKALYNNFPDCNSTSCVCPKLLLYQNVSDGFKESNGCTPPSYGIEAIAGLMPTSLHLKKLVGRSLLKWSSNYASFVLTIPTMSLCYKTAPKKKTLFCTFINLVNNIKGYNGINL